MAEKMVVLSKRISNKNTRALEKKLNKELEWAKPLIFTSEEVEIIVDVNNSEDFKEVVERVKKIAGNDYEVEAYEP